MRIHPMLCRSTLLCLATALAPVGAPLLYAQDVQKVEKSHHDGKRHKESKKHHGKRASHADAGRSHGGDAGRGARHADAARSSAPEHLQVVGFKRPPKANALGTIEEARLVQKNAPNIVVLMPQSEIEKIPNFVLGDAMRRMPGASIIFKSGESRALQIRGLDSSLNGVMFEDVLLPAGSMSGSGRAMPLDAMPASLAGALELTKTNRPEQDAIALGGQMNILSRDIGENQDPFLKFHLAGGYRDPSATPVFQGTLAGGMRFGLHGDPFNPHASGERPFSVSFFLNGLTDWLNMGDLQQKFASGDPVGSQANKVTQASQVMYAGHKVRYSYGGTLGWDIDHNNKIYLKMFESAIYAPVVRNQLIYAFSPKTGLGDPGQDGTASLSQGVTNTKTTDLERVYKFGGDSRIGRFKLDYFGAWAANNVDQTSSYVSNFAGPTNVPVSYDNVTNPLRPTVTVLNGLNPLDYNAYKLSSLSNQIQHDKDYEWTGHVGASTELNLFRELKGMLSFGGGLRMEHIQHYDPTYTYSHLPNVTAGQLAGSDQWTFFDGLYNIGYPAGPHQVNQLASSAIYPQVTSSAGTTAQQQYINDNENVYNTYLQYRATWRRLGILAGFRYEKTDGVYRGTQTVTQGSVTTLSPRAVGQEYANFFPTVQLRYNITDNLIARANWSTAVGRPGFNQVTASQTVNTSTNAVSIGNPGLKPTTGNNFDVSMEYYLPHGGIISGGAFYKLFKNYIVNYTNYCTGCYNLPGQATVSTYANIPNAYARGFELNYRQQFEFLPGILKGFGVGGNMTYVNSRGQQRNGTQETLPNTTSHVWNFEAFYNYGPVNVQFNGNYQGLTMTGLGSDPSLDSYVQPFLNFDIGASYRINRRVTVNFQARNFTNTMQNATQGISAKRMVELQYFGSAYMFGVDVSL
ncbi:TonB-dependent receptor [Gluconacetobacter asukensis]|uniref:TonB-dependent receptor n=1 Tax=Gluconacetobacter asukensis TaxID=1017181 RepID=A0A7W4IXU9_9PROT|nr:TonB-dependent receptor [Gluconacetobacter asukensis]MBB2171022.1 TonB-dependent receptor [Gluconacetobacter asukensis]